MVRWQKLLLGCVGGVLLVAVLVAAIARHLTRDIREREAILNPLLATNATLEAVMASAGHFTVTRRGTPLWEKIVSRYSTGSKWDRHIATKLEKASAYGHTSTMHLQTWIFLDERDRLIDFALGSQ